MSSNLLAHEVACMRDLTGGRGKLHHVAFYYGNLQHNVDAAEMFRDYDIQIEAGPDTHGITQGQFLYVFEPGGNRVELFGSAGFMHLDPDATTKTWDMADIDTGLAIGGAKLPWETYFTYGTPSPLALDAHIEKFVHFGPGMAPPETLASDRLGGLLRVADPERRRPVTPYGWPAFGFRCEDRRPVTPWGDRPRAEFRDGAKGYRSEAHAAHLVAARHGRCSVLLRLVGDDGLGGEEQSRDRGLRSAAPSG